MFDDFIKRFGFNCFLIGCFAVALLTTGNLLQTKYTNFLKNAETVYAEITDIVNYNHISPERGHPKTIKKSGAIVNFTIDNVPYSNLLVDNDIRSSTFKIGEKVKIYYNPENPNEFRGPDYNGYIMLSIYGFIFLFIFIFSITTTTIVEFIKNTPSIDHTKDDDAAILEKININDKKYNPSLKISIQYNELKKLKSTRNIT